MRVIRGVSIGVFLLLVCVSTPALAQEASIVGMVVDESKAVLPGVTVTATDVLKGTQAVAVTDERGNYRFVQLTPGTYRVQAELAGFANVVVEKIQLLVGQTATVPIVLKIAALAETLTVTGESPLVDVTSTQVAGNVNPTAMQEVPLLGRNWLELAKMVPGMTANVMTTYAPGTSADNWAMNLDGQQVSNKTSQGLGQPKFSRDAIAEYQIVTNLYDITQGRSEGVQLQAISKSGTNQTSGSAYGFFRDTQFDSADNVSHTVLPYQDQQYGGTIGGPIIQNKLHYFFSIEPERTPATIYQPVSALGESFSLSDNQTSLAMLLRVDGQLTKNDRLSIRATYSHSDNPNEITSGFPPSQGSTATQGSINALATWSKVLGNSAVQEIKVGLNQYTFSYISNGQTTFPNGSLIPEYDFPGLTVGPVYWMPQWHSQNYASARYDLTAHKGTHDLKMGGEFLDARMWDNYYDLARGQMTFNSLPSNLGSLIPASDSLNPAAWNLSSLNADAQKFTITIPRTNFTWVTPDPEFAFWIGDNWKVTNNLTITYGVRYDNFWDQASPPGITPNTIMVNQNVVSGLNVPGMTPGDFGYKLGTHDNLDFGPRAGFAYNVGGSNDLVIRGGTGLYYTVLEKQYTKTQILSSNAYTAQFNNNGSNPNFVENPTGGINTFAQASLLGLPQSGTIVASNLRSPMTWQSSLGFSKQINANSQISSDFIARETYREEEPIEPNLFYNPTTGYNVNPSAGVPNPAWGAFTYVEDSGRGDYFALQNSYTQRVWRRLQGGASYTLMFEDNDTNFNARANNPFNYLNGEWGPALSFQRNTVRGWLTYDLPWAFAISASYSYGSGNPFADTISSNPFGGSVSNRLNLATGGGPTNAITIPAAILSQWNGPAVIASGATIPRDALMGTSYNRTDLRLTKTIKLQGAVRAQLYLEIFNIFNNANYTAFNTTLSATAPATTAAFGRPTADDIPREGQLGFRFTF
jgi:Carboxypeptidase regulatory-like domain